MFPEKVKFQKMSYMEISLVTGKSDDYKIFIRITTSFYYEVSHFSLDAEKITYFLSDSK